MSRRANPRLVGGFVLGAVMLALAGVVVFGSGEFFATKRKFILFFDGSVGGLQPGAAVKFRGVEIGKVTEVLLSIDSKALSDVRMPVVIEVNQDRLYERGVRTVDLSVDSVVQGMIDSGLRAHLSTESFVTGRKYVAFDVYPDVPPYVASDLESPYMELPTIQTGLEELQADIEAVLGKLAALDAETLVASLTETIKGLDRVINDQIRSTLDSLPSAIHNFNATLAAVRSIGETIDTTMAPLGAEFTSTVGDAAAAMRELQTTLVSMRAVIEPGSPMLTRLERTLADLSEASEAIRVLADFVERNPSAMLRGKPVSEERK